MKQDCCAGIVTFNPDMSRLRKSLSAIAPQVSEIICCDNGSNNWDEISSLFGEYTMLSSIRFTQNNGIAFALNRCCDWAANRGYTWIITLDQDTVVSEGLVDALGSFSDESVGIVAPRVVYRGNEDYGETPSQEIEYPQWVITSASYMNLRAWECIQGFDEVLFIDKVDYDCCIRLSRTGYRIIRNNRVSIDHELGKLKCRRRFGRTIYVTNHSSFRKYYMTRNTIYLREKLGIGTPAIDIMKLIIKTLFYESDRIKKTRAIIRGIMSGFNLARHIAKSDSYDALHTS